MENMFLSIDGIEIEDLEEGDYTAYEEKLEEIRATIWVVEVNFSSIDYETMSRLNTGFKASRRHQLFFLPSTGGTELVQGWFHLMEPPSPSLTRWRDNGPEWAAYKLTFEEIDGHD